MDDIYTDRLRVLMPSIYSTNTPTHDFVMGGVIYHNVGLPLLIDGRVTR